MDDGARAPRQAPPRPDSIIRDHTPEPPAIQDEGYWAAVEAAAMSADAWHELEALQSGQSVPAADRPSGELLWTLAEGWEEAAIPRRPWIAKGYLLRGAVTVVSGPGSAGKSSLMVAWSACLTLGCAFGPFKVREACRVGLYNVEDDRDEQRRRFSAFAQELGLSVDAFMGRLTVLGPTGVGTLLHMSPGGRMLLNTPVMDRLKDWIEACKPDVLILDPFVELHTEEENDATAVRAVMAAFRSLAQTYHMAVVVLHHSKKGQSDPGDPDSLRGSSAIVGAGRVVLTLNVMSAEEAERASVAKERRRDYFRVDGAKNNYAPVEEAEWYERRVRIIGNGTEAGDGDAVAIAWPWRAPSVWKQFAVPELNLALDRIAAGFQPNVPWAPSKRGRDTRRWVGNALMEILNVTEDQAKQMVAAWLRAGLLYENAFLNPLDRHEAKGVLVDDAKRPE